MAAVFLVTIPSADYEKKLDSSLCKLQDSGVKKPYDGSPDAIKKNRLRCLNELEEVKVVDDADDDSSRINYSSNGAVAYKVSSSTSDSVTKAHNDKCMKQELEIGLSKLKITASTWTESADGKFLQVVFPCESQQRCEEILDEFYFNGIGRIKESSVSVVPCAVFNKGDDTCDSEIQLSELTTELKGEDRIANQKSQFIKSIKARLTVAQVVDGVRAGTLITFDFIAFIILAGLIAGFGLMDNSSVSIVASMLVSPLMGPIMALSFAIVISDINLIKLGLKAELLGLCTCITIGLCLGLITSSWAIKWGKGPWPTPEMFGRGQTRSLWVGMLVALPSGAGVALSILNGNISGLVGVAISASLLPPCVNAGILWGNAIVLAIQAHLQSEFKTIIYHNRTLTEKPSLLPPSNEYDVQYSTNMSYESGALGFVSMCLTLVNIVSIILSAILVFKIKEVAPPGSMPATSRFWREDIKIARDYNRTVHKDEPSDLGQRFQKEWNDLVNANGSATSNTGTSDVDQMAELAHIVQEAEEDEVYLTVRQMTHQPWVVSPTGNRLTWIPESEDSKPPPVWEAFRRSTRGPYVSSRRRNLTLVEARNRRCSIPSSFSQSTKAPSSNRPNVNDEIQGAAGRFQVTKVVSREPSQMQKSQVRKPRSARKPSSKYIEASVYI